MEHVLHLLTDWQPTFLSRHMTSSLLVSGFRSRLKWSGLLNRDPLVRLSRTHMLFPGLVRHQSSFSVALYFLSLEEPSHAMTYMYLRAPSPLNHLQRRRSVSKSKSEGRGSGLRNFQFHQEKISDFPKELKKIRFSRQKFPTTFFLLF